MKKLLIVTITTALILLLSLPALAAGETAVVSPGEDFVAGVWYTATVTNVVSEGAKTPAEVYADLEANFEYDFANSGWFYTERNARVFYCDNPATVEFINGLITVYWNGEKKNFIDTTYVMEDEDGYDSVFGDITFTAPGTYIIVMRDHLDESIVFYVVVGGSDLAPAAPTPVATATDSSAKTVNPTASTVYVNGSAQGFEAYNIEGNNFFKLRDLAAVLNGTEKQFAVGYDEATKAITLTSGEGYTTVGGELAAGDGTAKAATPTASKIYLDGEELALTAYNIGGNNFFKLRDLMAAIDVYVGYDEATKNITLDTGKGYTE